MKIQVLFWVFLTWKLVSADPTWTDVAAKINGSSDSYLTDSQLRDKVAAGAIIRRLCPSCWWSHREIYYKRLTTLPSESAFEGKTPENFMDLFLNNWFNTPKNKFNVDFELYSTYDEAVAGTTNKRWKYCNFNDATVGFPRDCGKWGKTNWNWVSFSRNSKDFTLQVEGDVPSLPPATLPPTLDGYDEWDDVAAKIVGNPNVYITDAQFRAQIESTNGIVRRLCDHCSPSHKEIYYKRLTDLPSQSDFGQFPADFMDIFLNNWFDNPKNKFNVDFELYSTYQDALAGTNRWTFCNFNDRTVGFPRDCGPTGRVNHNWIKMNHGSKDFRFQVEGQVPALEAAPALIGFDEWGDVAKKVSGSPFYCLTDTQLREQMDNTNGIVRRSCPSCNNSHKDIYYKRLTDLPTESDFSGQVAKSFLDLLLNNWMDHPKNKLNVDFELYSTYEDALSGSDRWTYCNYNDPGVGFPRDCGPNGYVAHQWIKMEANSKDFTFQVEGAVDAECKGPPVSCTATGWGDPHLITFDGLKYDAHAKGEVIMVHSLDSDFMIQARLQEVPGHWLSPAVTTAVAIRESDPSLPILQVSFASAGEAVDTINHCPVAIYANSQKLNDIAYDSDGVRVVVDEGTIDIEYPEVQVVMKVRKYRDMCLFSVDYTLLNCEDENVIGLLGSPNGNVLDDWMTRDGTVLDLPNGSISKFFFEPAYKYTTENWCLSEPNESILVYEPDMDFYDYAHCGNAFEPEFELIVETEPTPELKAVCGEDLGCLMDGLLLGEEAAEDFVHTPAAERKLSTEVAELVARTDAPTVSTPAPTSSGEICVARGWGDPHLITFDGLKYDAHAKGEVIMVHSLDSDFMIQARLQEVPGHWASPAVTTAVAIRESDPSLPIVQVSFANADGAEDTMRGCPVELYVNNEKLPDINDGYDSDDVQLQVIDGRRIFIDYPELQVVMKVSKYQGACLFSVDYKLLNDCRPDEHLIGLLGSPNGDPMDDWMTRDATVLDLPTGGMSKFFFEPAYEYTTENWCLTEPTESIFEYEDDFDFYDYAHCEDAYDPEFESFVETEPSPELRQLCGEDDLGCLMDGLLLGGEAAQEYLEEPAAKQPLNTAVSELYFMTGTPTASTPAPTAHDCQGADYVFCGEGQIQVCITDLSVDQCVSEASVVAGMVDGELAITCGYCPTPSPTASTPPPTASTSAPTTATPTGGAVPEMGTANPAAGTKPPLPPAASPTATENNPNAPSGSQGDPHFKTWQNEHFEYHGQCDLVLAKDLDFADGLGLDVQLRTKLVRFWSYIQRVAIRIGDDILEIQGSGDLDDISTANYWINFEYQGELTTIGGFPVTTQIKEVNSRKRHFTIDLSSKYPGVKIAIATFQEFVKIEFEHHTQEAFGNTVGLLGQYSTGSTVARDGVTVLNDFTDFGQEWQVLPSDDMLFHDVSDPQFPKKCIEPEDPQGARHRRLAESTVTEEQAEAACASLKSAADRKDCVYDILATQDLDMIGAY